MEAEKTGLIADIDCERIVLGSILNRPPLLWECREYLNADCFHSLQLQEIYESIIAIVDGGGILSYITLNAELQRRSSLTDLGFIAELMNEWTTDVTTYALRLKDLSCRRKLWELGQKLIQAGATETDDLVDIQAQAKNELDDLLVNGVTTFTTLNDKYVELQENIARNRSGNPVIIGTPTGFAEFDNRGGLMPTDLIIIAGESSHGKTAFATSLTLSAIQNGCNVAYYSMEMTGLQLTARITAMRSGLSSLTLMQKPMTDSQLMNVETAMNSLPKERLFFDENSTSSFEFILNSIRTMKLKHNIGGVVIDYLQILNTNNRTTNVEQQMASFARRLKNLAKDLNIWIIALSQMNRNDSNPYPTLNRLRDSGQIAEAADIVAFVFRPELPSVRVNKYPEPFTDASIEGTAMIDVAKGRNIGIFKFLCGFRSATTEFYELQTIPIKQGDETSDNCPF